MMMMATFEGPLWWLHSFFLVLSPIVPLGEKPFSYLYQKGLLLPILHLLETCFIARRGCC